MTCCNPSYKANSEQVDLDISHQSVCLTKLQNDIRRLRIVVILLVVSFIGLIVPLLAVAFTLSSSTGVDGTATGPAGFTTESGPTEVDGQNVDKGDPGKAGVKGTSEEGKGDSGSQGLPGDAGQLRVAGVPGPGGDRGLKGNDGSRGYTGEKGEREVSSSSGAVYVRWGSTICPNKSELVKEGVIGSGAFDVTGAGVDFLCLSLTPQWLDYNISASFVSWMRSVEYISRDYGLYPESVHGTRAVCAHCYTGTRSALLMLPAQTSCPSGWVMEYYGYLMASAQHYSHPSTYICVDHNPSSKVHSFNGYGGGLAFVNADCFNQGAIDECGPGQYVHNRQITCVVCSR